MANYEVELFTRHSRLNHSTMKALQGLTRLLTGRAIALTEKYVKSLLQEASIAIVRRAPERGRVGEIVGMATLHYKRLLSGVHASIEDVSIRTADPAAGLRILRLLLERLLQDGDQMAATEIWYTVDELDDLAVKIYTEHGFTLQEEYRRFVRKRKAEH